MVRLLLELTAMVSHPRHRPGSRTRWGWALRVPQCAVRGCLALRGGRQHQESPPDKPVWPQVPSVSCRPRWNTEGANKPREFGSPLRVKSLSLWRELFFPKQRSAGSTSQPWEACEGKAWSWCSGWRWTCPPRPCSQGFIVHVYPAGLSSHNVLSSLPILKNAVTTPPCRTTTVGLFTTLKGNPMSQPLGAQGIMSGIPLSVTSPGAQSLSRLLSIHKHILFFCQGSGPRF